MTNYDNEAAAILSQQLKAFFYDPARGKQNAGI